MAPQKSLSSSMGIILLRKSQMPDLALAFFSGFFLKSRGFSKPGGFRCYDWCLFFVLSSQGTGNDCYFCIQYHSCVCCSNLATYMVSTIPVSEHIPRINLKSLHKSLWTMTNSPSFQPYPSQESQVFELVWVWVTHWGKLTELEKWAPSSAGKTVWKAGTGGATVVT